MYQTRADELKSLHMAFWERRLEQPILNRDFSALMRTERLPALPPAWENQDGMMLRPEMLDPQELQPPPVPLEGPDQLCSRVVFNTLPPYWRLPWVAGLMGCGLQVAAAGRTIWPTPYATDDWFARPDLGFQPDPAWLSRLLAFQQYIIDRYYPAESIPALDPICRGPGDLLLHILSPDLLYLGFYDHPNEVKLLLDQITTLYITWARTQLDMIPPTFGGYCNFYGLWSPGPCIRTQSDYAINLSRRTFEEFIMPSMRRVLNSFPYQIVHTHSGGWRLAEWLLEIDELKAIEVSMDPGGPTVEQLIPLWSRILQKKSLILIGPLTQRQVDLLISSLPPCGLFLDNEIVSEEELPNAYEYEKRSKWHK